MKRRLIAALTMVLIPLATMLPTLSLPAVAADDEKTVPASVTVQEVISISISGAAITAGGFNFGSLLPGDTNKIETHSDNETPSITVTVEPGSTVHVDLQIKGTDFGTGFSISNAKYSTPTYYDTKTAMSDTYTTFATDVAQGVPKDLWHWLDVPSSGVTAGSYGSTFSYKAIAH